MMSGKIQHALDEKEIFELTGCLSKCDKYQYIATSWRDFKDKGVANTTNNQVANFYVTFAITTGRNEVKEQVEFELIMKLCNTIYIQYEFDFSTGFMTLTPSWLMLVGTLVCCLAKVSSGCIRP